MARPKKLIDPEQVATLARIDCTMIEIAAVVKCSVDTLERRFADVIKAAREEGNSSLRRRQHELAMDGNPTMLIWLGKQRLGQKEPDKGMGMDELREQLARQIDALTRTLAPEEAAKAIAALRSVWVAA
jgi:hypothetical protein